jgi:hypothetical protein
MARDHATVKQQIEQLKTSQEQMVRANAEIAEQLKAAHAQMARDNADLAEQLKAVQAQMDRPIVRDSEQNLRPKTSAPPPRSVGAQTPVSSTPPASHPLHQRDDRPEKRTASRKPARVIQVDDDLFLEGEDGGWRPCPACSMR